MNNRFIDNCHITMTYQRKPDTKSSFYFFSGQSNVLPDRISWGINSHCKKSNKLIGKINEVNAQYKKQEPGLYKDLNQGKIHTSIWGNPDFPEFYGYGILDERSTTNDLLIFYSENQCKETIEIHVFRGMGKPESLKDSFSYLRNIKRKPQ